MHSIQSLLLAMVVGLAACSPVDLPNQPYNLPERVGPGKQNLSASTAVSLFQQYCLATAPSFAAAGPAMRASGQFHNAPIDVYYLRGLNAQIRINETSGNWRCTMVFRSDAGASGLANTFRSMRVPGVIVFFQTTNGGTFSAIAQAQGL